MVTPLLTRWSYQSRPPSLRCDLLMLFWLIFLRLVLMALTCWHCRIEWLSIDKLSYLEYLQTGISPVIGQTVVSPFSVDYGRSPVLINYDISSISNLGYLQYWQMVLSPVLISYGVSSIGNLGYLQYWQTVLSPVLISYGVSSISNLGYLQYWQTVLSPVLISYGVSSISNLGYLQYLGTLGTTCCYS